MPHIDTAQLLPGTSLPKEANLQVYCGLDSCVTFEVHEELGRQYGQPNGVYNFERALQAPYLEIMQRGFKVDDLSRRKATDDLERRIGHLQEILDQFALAVWGRPLNPRSSKQLQDFFYTKLNIPEIWISQKGERKLSMNREVLEKLEERYLYARPFVNCILTIRELAKQKEVFETEIDADGRFRCSYNIAGTETGRPSSSENSYGTGGNAQNISPSLRYPFVADQGFKMCVIDLEQVEARDVGFFIGNLFGDWTFLDACECLTSDHEVLTPNGWTSIATKPEQILIWQNGLTRFETVERWNETSTSILIEFENRCISVQGTPEHEMPVLTDRTNYVEKRKLSDIITKPNFTAPNTGVYIGGDEFEQDAELIAAFQADGTRDESGKMHFTFSKERKIDLMRKLLQKSGLAFSEYHLGCGNTRFYIRAGQRNKHWPKTCGKEILSWSKESLDRFCNSHLNWDAHYSNNWGITSANYQHLDWLAVAFSLTGRQVSIARHKGIYWKLSIKNHKNTQYRSGKFTKKTVPETLVWCPTVSSGFFMVRRNGRIFISGNCGDLHTSNARLIWPELPWTGDIKQDKEIAGGNFYREFSYRDMAKRGSHLSNYSGTAWTASRALKVPIEIMEEFQARYIRGRAADPRRGLPAIQAAYPSIARWWQWTAQQLQQSHQLVTPFGRRRHFFGRPGDDTTLREAIAFLPQSTTADRMNLGLWRVWKKMPQVQLLAQTYDSITFQYPEGAREDDIIQQALELIRVELVAGNGRSYIVPGEAKVGWNWGYYHDPSKPIGPHNRRNDDGLLKWKLGKPDLRQRSTGLRRIG